MVDLKDDFLNKTEFNSIADVNEIVKVKSVIVVGHVKLIIPDIEWFYQACKVCTKKVYRPDDNKTIIEVSNNQETEIVYACKTKDCQDQLIDVVPRFKIPIRVQDSTGVVSLTFLIVRPEEFLSRMLVNCLKIIFRE